MEKVIISAAPAGAATRKEQNPAVPAGEKGLKNQGAGSAKQKKEKVRDIKVTKAKKSYKIAASLCPPQGLPLRASI